MKDTNGKALDLITIKNSVRIVEKLTANSDLMGTIARWDLQAIESIQVIDSIDDDKQRNKAIFKRKRKNNILTWGVIGGLLDASSGEDTIVDGVLLGGLFGMATSGRPSKPLARIIM